MRRSEYLSDPDVRAFIAWARPMLCVPGGFQHSWVSPRGGPWSCSSLYDAYLAYRWPDTAAHPAFAESERQLDALSSELRAALVEGDRHRFLEVASRVLGWGGVAGSKGGLDAFYTQLPRALELLDTPSADADYLTGVKMNSSFTKLYHLLLDDFPIYDGRVGAAIAYLVRLFLEAHGRTRIPPTLRFGWTPARVRADGGPNRDPGSARLRFPRLPGNSELHARCNVMAAWLIQTLSALDCFGEVPSDRRVRALEAALFMVGYDLPLANVTSRRPSL